MMVKITIELEGKEIDLTIDEARQLLGDLQKLLGEQRLTYNPVPLPSVPYYDRGFGTTPYDLGKVTADIVTTEYGTTTGGSQHVSNST